MFEHNEEKHSHRTNDASRQIVTTELHAGEIKQDLRMQEKKKSKSSI